MYKPEEINPYTFDEFLQVRDSYNDWEDNEFLQKIAKHFIKEDWDNIAENLKTFSKKTSFKWRKVAEEIARPEKHPTIRHFDAYNHRVDEIVRPYEAVEMQNEVFAEKFFSDETPLWEQMLKRHLLHHNGEAGIMCPIACTDGLVDLLEHFKHELPEELKEMLRHCKEGIDGDFGVGAQFMTEIQGGSNIPANVLKAVPEGGHYRLYGTKFFCSAIHADYTVITAKVEGSGHVATFVVPLWENREKKIRNRYVINRLKWKLGTTELPSGEVTFEGSKAYQIGPLEKGVAIAVGIVLTKSRLDIGLASSAFMLRAVREALQYSQFREVFGRRIHEFPLAAGQLQDIERTAKRTTAGVFKVYHMYLSQKNKNDSSEAAKREQFLLRELILLQKIKAAKDTIETLRTAISIFGGNGVIEDFSAIPRLYRDAMVNELWEGPRNVLLAQIHRDLNRIASWYPPEQFVSDLLENVESTVVKEYAEKLKTLLACNLTAEPNVETVQAAREWERFCDDLFFHYQEQALKEAGDAPIVKKYSFKKQLS